MRSLEPLGTQQRVSQVNQQSRRHETGQPIIETHRLCPLHAVAGESVGGCQHEEAEACHNKNNVRHNPLPIDIETVI